MQLPLLDCALSAPPLPKGGCVAPRRNEKGRGAVHPKATFHSPPSLAPDYLISCEDCECPSRSDGPPNCALSAPPLRHQGVASLRDAGANTYTPIHALCADAGQFAVSLHKSPVAPKFTKLQTKSSAPVQEIMVQYLRRLKLLQLNRQKGRAGHVG